MTPPPRVVIVDDHPIWRDALERDLTAAGFHVVGAFGDGETAVRTAAATKPDVALLDVQLPGLSGAQTAAALVAIDPSVRILMFSASGEDADVLDAVMSGARGYLVKSAPRAELIDAVTRTAAGEAVFGAGLAGLVLGEHQRAQDAVSDAAAQLTGREREVLQLVATGLTAKQIAHRMVVSHRTVQNHIQSALRKLQLHNRVELTRWAIDHGIAD
jgi:DNA-binding NarL/FixJ family response regulator